MEGGWKLDRVASATVPRHQVHVFAVKSFVG